ncbi:hypothetical protein DCO60_06390 [Helicobacter saguini]|uniref:glycosyltransferase family 9 protein n=1 Tax=Helicobacter saguini TaxID=1548018 RepID=UPI001329152F|nr:glycosyltransferase family 9 protein [Helicobacter saguini]MWV62073.1 hypothetical protein [Helicobacter saguini]
MKANTLYHNTSKIIESNTKDSKIQNIESKDTNSPLHCGGGSGGWVKNTTIESKEFNLQDDNTDSKNIESKIHTFKLNDKNTLHTHNSHLKIPKIDYIYFADSNISLRQDCLSECKKIIESNNDQDSNNPNKTPIEIIYFKIFNHFKDVETKDFMESLLYNIEHEVCGFNFITHLMTQEIPDFSFSYDILINFNFLVTKNITFMENIYDYMKLFSVLVIANASRIYIFPQNLAFQISMQNIDSNNTKEIIAKSYLNMALALSAFCEDSKEDSKNTTESNPKDSKENIESKIQDSKENIESKLIKQNITSLFTYHYYTKALKLLDNNPSDKIINQIESLSQKFQNIKPITSNNNSIESKLGQAVSQAKRNIKRTLKLPFTLLKIIKSNKNAKQQQENQTQIIESKDYKLGKAILESYTKNPLSFLALPITLPLLNRKIKKQLRKEANKIHEIQINPPNKTKPKLIINQADVGVGDYLGLRPLFPQIREYYKDYEITFLASHRYIDIVKEYDKDYIDVIIYCDINDEGKVFSDYKAFFESRFYDILLYPYTINDWFVHLSEIIKAKVKILNYTNPLFLGKNRCEENKIYYTNQIYTTQDDIFEIYRYKEFFESLFAKPLQTPSISLPLDQDRFSKINFDFTQKYAIIFPGTTDIHRMYDINNYAALAAHLHRKYGIISYILGAPHEDALASTITNDYIISLCGKYSLVEILYILNKSKLILCNDSGGYHLSMCVASNIIVISGGGVWTRFVNYPDEFKVGKLVSTPLPKMSLLIHTTNITLTTPY